MKLTNTKKPFRVRLNDLTLGVFLLVIETGYIRERPCFSPRRLMVHVSCLREYNRFPCDPGKYGWIVKRQG